MNGQELRRGRGLRRAVHLTAATMAIAGTGAVSGCLNRELQPEDTRTTSTFVSRLQESAVDKIDLLLTIDNSRSMADKQQILAMAVPDLVRGLVNPRCVDPADPNNAAEWKTPALPTDECPTGTAGQVLKRDFTPVLDIHIGLVTSSIGGHGADSCPNEDSASSGCPQGVVNYTNNDKGHLIYRKDACSSGPANTLPTYNNAGFLAWDPNGQQTPPGEKAIGELNIAADGKVTTVTPGLVPALKDMVIGAGQVGCGYEAQMEGWYRFLVDPDPYLEIKVDNGKAVPSGNDDVLIQQRKDFLRPNSLLAIIGLTDENDCSIKEYGQFYLAAQQKDPAQPSKDFHLPKARSECEANPNDPCCKSCAQNQQGCGETCAGEGATCGNGMPCINVNPDPKATPEYRCQDINCPGSHSGQTDDLNLRCFDQKRRFGIDFLYPVDRYVSGLKDAQVPGRDGQLKPNPIFSDLNPGDSISNVRDAGLVFMAFIVGVPWQDIARQGADGKPNLVTGLNKDGKPVGGFKSFDELAMPLPGGTTTTWDIILGDPENYVPPLDPHMIESTKARSGTNPITGDTIAPTTAPNGTDSINGHEYTPGTQNGVQVAPNDLQYACIFPLPDSAKRNCAQKQGACDCSDPKNDNPLCDVDSSTGNRQLQSRAKAYPGIRQLNLIKKLGPQGIVGSICPAQLTDQAQPDFGYRPAIGAIIDRLKTALGGQCLPRKLSPKADGTVQCLVLEAQNTAGKHKFTADGGDCDAYCNGKSTPVLVARQAVTTEHKPAVAAAMDDPAAKAAGWDCFCEIKQLSGQNTPGCGKGDPNWKPASDLDACQCDANDPPTHEGQSVDGWCYIDATTTPQVGNEDLVAACPGEKRKVRFAGDGNQLPGSTLFITCAGE